MFNVNTGFGYYLLNGVIIGKCEFPIGQHPDPTNGATYVEVNSQSELDAIIVPLTPVQIAAQQTLEAQATLKASAISKLTALGLSMDEINAIIG